MTKLQDQIDASVLVEHLLPSKGRKKYREIRNACRKYVYRLIKREIKGTMSYGALGEIWLAVRKQVSPDRQGSILHDMNELIHKCDIAFNAPKKETYEMATKILDGETIMKPSDALRIAECKTLEKERFITIDQELLENKRLEAKTGIKIRQPK